VDNTAAALAEAQAERGRSAEHPPNPPILGIHLVVGSSFREKMANGQRATTTGRTRLINAVLSRP
jgi:hypothetical protein